MSGAAAMGGRWLLCRPQNGLNDMLCTIEAACRYAERFGRTVVVDTAFDGASHFRDRFSRYFVSRQADLLLDLEAVGGGLDDLETAPACLRGRIGAYRARYDVALDRRVDADSGVPLTFDFEVDHPEPLLVHHHGNGGNRSFAALARLRLHDSLVDELVARLRAIGAPYSALHIRHTDYRSHYESELDALSRQVAGPVFIATDNREALAHCRAAFGPDRVHAFADLPQAAGRTLHDLAPSDDAWSRNRDAILDLVMLGLSTTLYTFKLAPNHIGTTTSGFSRLAIHLVENRPLLRELIGRHDPVFG